jgi:hypothetical protein
MANPSDFDLKITGPESSLMESKQFLLSGIEECPGGGCGWGRFNLLTEKLFADIDPKREHIWVGLGRIQNLAIVGPESDPETGVLGLYLEGSAKWAPPFELIARLSKKYPDLTFHIGATTDDYCSEEWVVKNGSFSLVTLIFCLIQDELTIQFVRDGKPLDVPDFEDDSYECVYYNTGGPHALDPKELADWCTETYRKYLGCECPGVESGQLRTSVLKLLQSRAKRFGTQPDIDWDEEPGEQVHQMSDEMAACEKVPGAELPPVAGEAFTTAVVGAVGDGADEFFQSALKDPGPDDRPDPGQKDGK